MKRGMFVLNSKQTKAKEYLKQAFRYSEMLKASLEEIESIRSMSTNIASPDLTKERVNKSHSSDPAFVNAVIKLADLEKQVDQEIVDLLDMKQEIRNTINQVSDVNGVLILRYRYLDFMKWEDIADKMGYYSIKSLHRIHHSALEEVADILEAKEAA